MSVDGATERLDLDFPIFQSGFGLGLTHETEFILDLDLPPETNLLIISKPDLDLHHEFVPENSMTCARF